MDDIHVSLRAEELFKIGPVPVTNSMLTMFLVMALVLTVFILIARRATMIPQGKGQGLLEMLIGFVVDLVEGSGGKRLGRRILPLISGIFIFILFSNFSGLLPGIGTITLDPDEEHATEGEHAEATTDEHAASTPEAGAAAAAVNDEGDGGDSDEASTDESAEAVAEGEGDDASAEEEHEAPTPLFRPPTADLNMTFALSILAFTAIQIAGISAHGVVGRIKHMANPPFLFPIEVIGELSRILSLSARLFGNVFAGEILLGVMYAIGAAVKIAVIPALFPIIFLGLEVLFGTIQALVFALLTLIYIMLASAHDEHHDDEHHAEADAHAPVASASVAGD
jgi:F-type H+-transporting ATPase subunit a